MINSKHYISDNYLSFADYIKNTRSYIAERRLDLQFSPNPDLILNANSPFELYPAKPIYAKNRLKYGILLIHGLLDSPFSLREIGDNLQKNGILCRAILLPGHGTRPADLMTISYLNWMDAVHYGIQSLREEVEHIFLLGYSTGAALSIYHALSETNIAGLILLAPAIGIRAPIDIAMGWHRFSTFLKTGKHWLYTENELDYAKYLSVHLNAVSQVGLLIRLLKKMSKNTSLNCPLFMALSHEDETISSRRAIRYFLRLTHPRNQLLLYTSKSNIFSDNRILIRNTFHPELGIKHFSHISLPFSPNNPHYGQNGDYVHASRTESENMIFGAYNRLEVELYNLFHRMKITNKKRRELTYNPDFNFMTEKIVRFIKNF